ncbi:MAG: hypothetical protein WAR77_04285 [Saprospiraceae bacterium]
MKHLLFIFLPIASLAMYSCSKETEQSQFIQQAVTSVPTHYRLLGGNGFVVLLKQYGTVADNIYILRTNQFHDVNRDVYISRLNEFNEGLDIKEANGRQLIFSLASSMHADFYGYSLSIVSGLENFTLFYNNGNPKSNPDVDAVKCACKGINSVSTCDSGGNGATDCSIETTANVAGTGITDKCTVKCGDGYYACCKK